MALTRASKKSDVRSPSKQQLTIFLSYRRVIGLAVGDARRLALFRCSISRARASERQRQASNQKRSRARTCVNIRRARAPTLRGSCQ